MSPGQPAQRERVDSARDRVLLEALIREFTRVELQVSGGCMWPVLPAGARVGLERAARRPPRLGDIVLVRTKLGLRLHRVVWKLPFSRSLRTKGDQATAWDPPVALDDILGIVVSSDAAGDPSRGRLWRTFRSLAGLVRARMRRTLVRGGRRSASA